MLTWLLYIQEREYGRSRLWGAVGWGCLAPVAGAVVARFGIRATFVCNIALAALGFVPTLLLPIGSLREQRPSEAVCGPPETASQKLHPHGNFIDVYADSAAHSPSSACTRPATPPASGSATADDHADAEAGEAGRRSQGEASTAHEPLEETIYDVAAHVPLISAPELLVPSCTVSAVVYFAACVPAVHSSIRRALCCYWLQNSRLGALHVREYVIHFNTALDSLPPVGVRSSLSNLASQGRR